jgi:hypothetical protein
MKAHQLIKIADDHIISTATIHEATKSGHQVRLNFNDGTTIGGIADHNGAIWDAISEAAANTPLFP